MERVGSANGRTGPVPVGGRQGRVSFISVYFRTQRTFVSGFCVKDPAYRTVSAFIQKSCLFSKKRQLSIL